MPGMLSPCLAQDWSPSHQASRTSAPTTPSFCSPSWQRWPCWCSFCCVCSSTTAGECLPIPQPPLIPCGQKPALCLVLGWALGPQRCIKYNSSLQGTDRKGPPMHMHRPERLVAEETWGGGWGAGGRRQDPQARPLQRDGRQPLPPQARRGPGWLTCSPQVPTAPPTSEGHPQTPKLFPQTSPQAHLGSPAFLLSLRHSPHPSNYIQPSPCKYGVREQLRAPTLS